MSEQQEYSKFNENYDKFGVKLPLKVKVYKYAADDAEIPMYSRSVPVLVGEDSEGVLSIWVEHAFNTYEVEHNSTEVKKISVIGTGQTRVKENYKHIGSTITKEGLVWHVYMEQ